MPFGIIGEVSGIVVKIDPVVSGRAVVFSVDGQGVPADNGRVDHRVVDEPVRTAVAVACIVGGDAIAVQVDAQTIV